MARLLVIALGGVLGSLARYLVNGAVGPWDAGRWPWSTLTVNLVGCLLIGVIAASVAIERRGPLLRPFLITGVLGGFTTFSALALETGVLLDSGRIATAAAYLLVTMAGGLAAVALGRRLVRA